MKKNFIITLFHVNDCVMRKFIVVKTGDLAMEIVKKITRTGDWENVTNEHESTALMSYEIPGELLLDVFMEDPNRYYMYRFVWMENGSHLKTEIIGSDFSELLTGLSLGYDRALSEIGDDKYDWGGDAEEMVVETKDRDWFYTFQHIFEASKYERAEDIEIIVEKLKQTLSLTREFEGIKLKLDYPFVIATFKEGGTKRINIECDSGSSVVRDIMRALQ